MKTRDEMKSERENERTNGGSDNGCVEKNVYI